MGTNLINAIQHRNGPNQRPPNSIWGNSGANQRLFASHMLCGVSTAIICAILLVIYLNYSLAASHNNLGAGIILLMIFSIFLLLLAALLLICHKVKAHDEIVFVQPNYCEFQPENSAFSGVSNGEKTDSPPTYDCAVVMPKTTLPPAYENINIV